MRAKLISVLGGLLLSVAALPWVGPSDVAATPAMPAPQEVAPRPAIVPAPDAPEPALDPFVDVPEAAGVSSDVLGLALRSVRCAVSSGDIKAPRTLTVIDYSRPSVEPRLWVFDYATGDMLYKELVAHGRNTGDNMARHFSDTMESRQSSIGLFVTDDTYIGSNGYSLRLDGLEPGFNGNARPRAIVMHGAPYVNAELARSQGRIGRSWGCPALREAVAHQVIDTIRGGGVIFSYYPDQEWLKTSRFINCGGAQA